MQPDNHSLPRKRTSFTVRNLITTVTTQTFLIYSTQPDNQFTTQMYIVYSIQPDNHSLPRKRTSFTVCYQTIYSMQQDNHSLTLHK